MQNKIYPCLWFNGNANEAAEFYTSVFRNTKILSENPLVTMLQLEGQNFMLLNGGPAFTKNPSVSFMVLCDSKEEVKEYWQKLLPGSQVLMELDAYPWSEQYGWIQDSFGVSWQLYVGDNGGAKEKAVPTLMFAQNQNGRAREAVNFYTSVFPNSEIQGILDYGGTGGEIPGNVQHAQFDIGGFTLMAMDSSEPHSFSFNEGISLVVNCDTQEEIDFYWEKLINGGGYEQECGWLKDKFGVSWQIVPSGLGELMNHRDKAQRVSEAIRKMKKIDMKILENA